MLFEGDFKGTVVSDWYNAAPKVDENYRPPPVTEGNVTPPKNWSKVKLPKSVGNKLGESNILL